MGTAGLTSMGQGGHARMETDKEVWYLQPIYKPFNSIIDSDRSNLPSCRCCHRHQFTLLVSPRSGPAIRGVYCKLYAMLLKLSSLPGLMTPFILIDIPSRKKGTSLPLLLHQAQNRHISSSPMMIRIWQTSCRSPTLSPLRSLQSSQVKLPQVPPDLHVLHNPYINFTSCDPSTGCQVSNGNRISSMRFQLAMTWKASLMRKSSPQQPTTMMNGLVLTCRVSLIPVED